MKYFLGFLVVIAMVIAVAVLIVKGFSGGSPAKTTKQLVDYANTDQVVKETIIGPLSTDDMHYTLRVTIGASQSVLEVLKGYDETVTQTFSYNNTETAYAEFLRAIDLSGFTRGNPKLNTDDRGVCTGGRRYVFEIQRGDSTVQHFWTTTCGSGNFTGNLNNVSSLFMAQIPDFSKVSNLVSL